MVGVPNAASVRVLVADDHAAVRAGVAALVDAEPGLTAVGAVADAFAVAPAIQRSRPDIVVLDFQLPGIDGVTLCRQLARTGRPPAAIIYSAFVSDDMLVPAYLAGARAVIDKTAEPRELMAAVHRVALGETLLAPPTDPVIHAAAQRLAAPDRAILLMLLDACDTRTVADAVGIAPADIEERVDAILARLVVGCWVV